MPLEVTLFGVSTKQGMFATDPLVGIKPSSSYKFMVITSPVGAYYSHPVRVKIEEGFKCIVYFYISCDLCTKYTTI